MQPQEFMTRYAKKFRQNYIMQRFVNSVTDSGSPFDIRIHLYRGQQGKWTLPLVVPRIGSNKGVVSNLAAGGNISLNVVNFLQTEIGDDWDRIRDEIVEIVDKFPVMLQKRYARMIDALAFDVGVDRDNNNELKFFEVNSGTGALPFHFEIAEAGIHFYMALLEQIKAKMPKKQP